MGPPWGERRKALLEWHEGCLWFLQRHTYPCLPLPLSLPSSFFLFLATAALVHSVFPPPHPFLHRGGIRGPKETSSQRQGWQVNLRGSHSSNFTFQRLLFTGLRLMDSVILFFFLFFFFFLERFCHKHYKDWGHQYRLHSEWSIYVVKLKKIHE